MLYRQLSETYGPALGRLVRADEADAERRRDLLQEVHVALWRSLATFDERCSLRTWVFRVAHNVATSHVIRDRRAGAGRFITLRELELEPSGDDTERAVDRRKTLERVVELVQRLTPMDRQVIHLYLEGMDAAAIGAITGLSAANVATRVHRIKNVLAQSFRAGSHDE